jgi:hypothetical protein
VALQKETVNSVQGKGLGTSKAIPVTGRGGL